MSNSMSMPSMPPSCGDCKNDLMSMLNQYKMHLGALIVLIVAVWWWWNNKRKPKKNKDSESSESA
jgi:hypothetical protein